MEPSKNAFVEQCGDFSEHDLRPQKSYVSKLRWIPLIIVVVILAFKYVIPSAVDIAMELTSPIEVAMFRLRLMGEGRNTVTSLSKRQSPMGTRRISSCRRLTTSSRRCLWQARRRGLIVP